MKIAIICQDTFPLVINTTDEHVLNKCSHAGALGKRAYQFYNDLSSTLLDLEVDIYIPHYNFPDEKLYKIIKPSSYVWSKIQTNYIKYNFKKGIALKNLLTYGGDALSVKGKYDYIYIQTSTGVNFKQISFLPKSIHTKIIVDNWVPFLQEQEINLKRYKHLGERQFKKFQSFYSDLIRRADIILYENTHQLNYLEGYLHSLDYKLDDKKIIKYKYNPFISQYIIAYDLPRKTKNKNLVWYGSVYPWYDISNLLNFSIKYKKYKVTFYGVKHPRYSNYYNSEIKQKLIDASLASSNIHVIENFYSAQEEFFLLNNAVAIVLDNKSIENRYAVRVRVLDLLAKGVIVITNSKIDNLNMNTGLYYIDNIYKDLVSLLDQTLKYSAADYRTFYRHVNDYNIKDFIKE